MQEAPNIQIPQIKCKYQQKAIYLCFSQDCTQSALICSTQGCLCNQKDHINCDCCQIKSIVPKLVKMKINPPKQIQETFKAVQKIYDNIIDELSKQRQLVGQQLNMFGLKKYQAHLLSLLIDYRSQEIKGNLVLNVKKQLSEEPLEANYLTADQVQDIWKKQRFHLDKLIKSINNLCDQCRLRSAITRQQSLIKQFLVQPVARFQLLYRASQNNFSASTFHQICKDKKHTLILALTQAGRIVGGYTPNSWNSSAGWTPDETNKSFLFSITLREKYNLNQPQYATYASESYGPTFGAGHDFYIADNANSNNSSYCNFPSSYNNNIYSISQSSYTAFGGATSGYNFKITEWEVFQVEWR